MHTFARQLLNMCFQSFQKCRYLATIVASASNPNFSLPSFSDSRTIVASTLHRLLEGVRTSSENKVQLSICLATPWSLQRKHNTNSRYSYKSEDLNMQATCTRILFPGTDHSTTEVQSDCLPSLASMPRTQNLVMREGESPTLQCHVPWSTVVAGAIGASQFEELFILQSNSLDHVETIQRAGNAGYTNYVDNPSMNQGMRHLHGIMMVIMIAAMVRPHQCIQIVARDKATPTSHD